jgi:formylglycine-generating enzyme required for sulfatase activity
MSKLVPGRRSGQVSVVGAWVIGLVICISMLSAAEPQDKGTALSEKQMQRYTQQITGTDVAFDMVPIPSGQFVMGSPPSEKGRKPDEGPQHQVKIEPFWMGKCEVTWDEYDLWTYGLDVQRRKVARQKASPRDVVADAVTRPTKPYTDMTFDMGHDGFPAICMTQLAAKMYCKWLTEKTGRYYRLPTEAEWEYACRAGSETAYFFGNDPWFDKNSSEHYHKVGKKQPNRWGLYDIHGNVAEWVLDQYRPDFYAELAKKPQPVLEPLALPTKVYGRIVRGGSWDQDEAKARCAARDFSIPDWKIQDPQIPQSIWYLTDARFVGFRVIRPLRVPDQAERDRLNLEPAPKDLIKE